MHVLQICAVLLSFISLLLLLISLGSDHWVEGSDGSYLGLWNICQYTQCISNPSPTSSLDATRAFMLIGMIFGAVSFFGLCFTFFKTRIGSISVVTVSAIASLAAGLCAMIAMAVFTANAKVVSDLVWYGWSFGLGWVSFLLFLITGGLSFAYQSVTTE